jgi:hypothetical protein
MVSTVSEKIRQMVAAETARLRRIPEAVASAKPTAEKWSRKEVLGHLIDSAGNNHQRFVRALLDGELVFPAYAQNEWVRVQTYSQEGWDNLVDLWGAFNLHLAHIIEAVPVEKIAMICHIGSNPPVTLEALISDYLRHQEHHLQAI